MKWMDAVEKCRDEEIVEDEREDLDERNVTTGKEYCYGTGRVVIEISQ